MAKYSNTVEYNIKTTLDQTGLTQLQTQIRQVESHLKTLQTNELIPKHQATQAIQTINQVQAALTKAFNPRLGILDNKALIGGLNNIKGGINGVYQAFAAGGIKGTQAFASLYGQMNKVDKGMRQVSSTADKIMNTLGNTVRWGLIASAFASVMNAAHQSAEYVKDLDRSLTNIMMVSGETRDNMNEFAKQANQVAQRLGGTTVQMTEATKVFIQQGYSLDKSSQLGEYAVHLANVSEQDSATASDEITAYMNAFKIPLEDLGNAISKWAAVANNTAVDVEELSIASQKAASVAATVGVDLDQFAGHIAAIESVTREAPENIGNGLKTIYSRIADISLGETLEDGVNLGSFAKALEKVGVNVLDNTGKLRDAGIILEDLMGVWQELDNTQRAAVAKTVAGRFQLARFEALMNRADIYENAANISRAETGTATYDRMQETYRESLEGKSNALTATIEEIFLNAFETDSFYDLIDAVTVLTKTFAQLIQAVGGGGAALTAFAALLTKSFSTQISQGITNMISNRQAAASYEANRQAIQQQAVAQLAGRGITTSDAYTQKMVNNIAGMNQYATVTGSEQEKQKNAIIEEQIQLYSQRNALIEHGKTLLQGINIIAEQDLGTLEKAIQYFRELEKDENDIITLEDMRASGLDKITAQYEQQAQLSNNIAGHLSKLQGGRIASDSTLNKQFRNDNGQTTTIRQMAEAYTKLGVSQQLPVEMQQKLSGAFKTFEAVANKEKVTIEQLKIAFEQVGQETSQLSQRFNALYEAGNITKAELEQLLNALMGVEVGFENSSKAAQAFKETMHLQNTINGVVSLASSIMSISFGIQSLANLPNIWANQDLTFAEKFLETTMNLGMGLTMLLPGLTMLPKAFKEVVTGIKGWAAAQLAADLQLKLTAADAEAMTAALVAEQIALNLSKTGYGKLVGQILLTIGSKLGLITVTEGMTAALEAEGVAALFATGSLMPLVALAAPLLALAAVIGIVAFAVNDYSEKEEKRKEALQASIDASNTAVAAIKENKEALDNLYDEYNLTKEASDDFKKALLDQAKALGIVNAEQMVALGQYKDLKQEIDEATKKQLMYNNALLQQQNKDLSPKVGGVSDSNAHLASKAGINYTVDTIEGEGFSTNIYSSSDSQYTQLLKYQEAAKKGQEEIVALQSELGELTLKTVDTEEEQAQKEQDIINKKKEIEDKQKEINEFTQQYSSEEAQQLLANNEQIVENQRLIALYSEDSVLHQNRIGTLDELETLIQEGALGEELKAYYASLGPEAARAFLLAFGQELNNEGLGLDKEDLKFQSAMNVAGAKYAKEAVKRGSFESQASGQDYFESIMTGATDIGINQDFYNNLTTEDRTKIILGIDTSGTQEEITKQINEVIERINNGETLEEIYPDINIEDTDEDILSRKENGRGDKEWDRDTESVKAYANELQELADISDKVVDNLDENREAAIRIADANSRMNKGIKTLKDNWSKWSDVLSDPIDYEGTAEYAEALEGAKSALTDVLDIDVSTFSNSTKFIQDNFDDIAAAADGDVDAIQRLRMAAEEQILIDAGIDLDNMPADVAALQGILAETDFDDIEIGASLDTLPFYDALIALQDSAVLSTGQIQAILNSLGFEPDISYVDVPMSSTSYDASTSTYTYEDPITHETKTAKVDSQLQADENGILHIPIINGSKTTYQGSPGAAINAGNRGGSGGGKGGGGGGGGKGNEPKSVKKSADIDKSKPAEAENDIYEKVNATLEKLKDSYSKLNKVKDRTWGKEYRDDAQKGLDLLVKEQKTLDRRIEIAKKYADALKTGKSNLAYGIDMTDKESLASLGLKDSDLDGVIDNYISKFEEVRQAARKLDAEAEDYRNKANAEALAYWQSKGGRLDGEGNVITEASMSEDESEYYSKLIERQKNHYDKLVEKANEQWELAEKINDVTKDYEDTMNQIRDDEEEQLDLAHEIEDIQIDLYQRSLDMLDTMHDINDIAAQMKGFFTKLATDDPFRALTESAQAFENSFKDATYNATAYYNDIIEKLQKEQAQVKANGGEWEKYNEAIEFYNQQKANAITNADGLDSGELAQQSRRLTELERWIQNPNAVDNPYGTNTQALYDAYQEQYQKVTDAALEAEERMESVHESIIEAYDKMAEQQDELVQQYDRIDEQLNRTADRISLYRGEDAYADQATISKQRAKVALEAGKSSLKALDKYRQQLAKAQEQQELERPQKVAAAEAEVARLQMALNADKNNLDLQQQLATAKTVLEQAKYDDSEEIKWLKNQIDETTDYINDKADEAAEHFKDAYENSIDEIAAQTTDKIFGNRDLDLITNDWDWDRDYFGSYKDNVERTLETEKLRLKYLDLLDSAQGSSLGIQRQIKDAMDEQLALLENQKTMSEYDVKLANARLEILQKQIALENAQQNKNQMKLRRDSQGNYKYVYAADQDDIRGKQQELLESEFDAYEMSKDANGESYQQGIALYQQYIEQRTAIEKKYANDVDTMEKELAKLRENYSRAAEANAEDVQDTYNGMIISVQWMAEHGTEAVQQMTEDVLHALEEKTQESLEAVGIPWNDAIYQGLTDLGNLQQTIDDTSEDGINAAKEFVNAINGEGDSVVNLIKDANESMQQSFEDTVVAINSAEDATNELATATANLNEVMGAELGAIDGAKRKIQEYEEQLFAAKESTSALAGQLTATQKSLAEKSKEAEQWKTTYENYKRSVQEEKEAAIRKAEEEKKKAEAAKRGGAAGNASTSDIAWGIAQNIWTYGSWGNDPDRHSRISERYGEEVANLTQRYINEYWASGQLVNYDSKKWGYASGGYTGTWGKDSGLDGENGKLAFLHQKELVLNQQDTENILEAVQVMRSIMDITKLASLGSSGFDVRRISQTAADTIEQRVEITAEFPAANSADDIRQALLGLSDAAMQYAYRER